MTDLEKAARAANAEDDESGDLVTAERMIRAALLALREPSDNMLMAMYRASPSDDLNYVDIWQSAIDAALEEKQP